MHPKMAHRSEQNPVFFKKLNSYERRNNLELFRTHLPSPRTTCSFHASISVNGGRVADFVVSARLHLTA